MPPPLLGFAAGIPDKHESGNGTCQAERAFVILVCNVVYRGAMRHLAAGDRLIGAYFSRRFKSANR